MRRVLCGIDQIWALVDIERSNVMTLVRAISIVGFAVTMFLGLVFSASSQEGNLDENYSALIREMVAQEWAQYRADYPDLPGGIALQILTPKGDYFTTYGIEGDITNKHYFRAASITKTFTAAAILLLQQDGLLNIEDAVISDMPGRSEAYLPDSSDYDIPHKNTITIRELLEHWAGVFDICNSDIPLEVHAPYSGHNYLDYVLEHDPNHTFTVDEIVGVVATCGLSYSPPGTAFHYSDTGYVLLAKIIERVSGKDYGEFVTQRFLLPNDLADASLPYMGTDQTLPEPSVIGFNYYKGEFAPVLAYNPSYEVANGNLVASPVQLASWARMLYSGQAGLQDQYKRMMMDIRPLSDSLGYGLGTEYIKGLGYGHSGGMEGYLSRMVYDPDSDVSVVIYANVLNWDDPARQLMLLTGIIFRTREILSY